jgi:hypothetical protein
MANFPMAVSAPLRQINMTAASRSRFRWWLQCAALLISWIGPGAIAAQQVTISGVVTERSQSLRLSRATIRLSEIATAYTDRDGRFQFSGVSPGRYTLLLQAFGYRSRSIELQVRADTSLTVELEPDPVPVDSLVVRGETVTIRGRVRDAESGLKVLQAEITLDPGARAMGALSGDFTLEKMPKHQPFRIRVDAIEYLPAFVELTPARDTTLHIALTIDSVALRLIAQQRRRLQSRFQALPHSLKALNRDEISRTVTASIGELIRHNLPHGTAQDRPPYRVDACIFFDDVPATFQDLVNTPPQLIDRVEILGYRGKMIRVYSKRYVASLMKRPSLPPLLMMDIGLGKVCV